MNTQLFYAHSSARTNAQQAESKIQSCSMNVDAENTIMATDNVDHDVDALQLAREELFGYLKLIQNSPPVTLSKTKQMIGLVKKMLDEVNNLHILDYEFTLGLRAYESYLSKKKSFLSPKKKNKRRKQNSGFDIDLNVHPSEYEPCRLQYLNKRGRLRSNNASSIALEVQQSTSMDHSIQGLGQMQIDSSFPILSVDCKTWGEASSSTIHGKGTP